MVSRLDSKVRSDAARYLPKTVGQHPIDWLRPMEKHIQNRLMQWQQIHHSDCADQCFAHFAQSHRVPQLGLFVNAMQSAQNACSRPNWKEKRKISFSNLTDVHVHVHELTFANDLLEVLRRIKKLPIFHGHQRINHKLLQRAKCRRKVICAQTPHQLQIEE